MMKIIFTVSLIFIVYAANSQILTAGQLTSLFKDDGSQLNNFLTIRGWRYNQSLDSLGAKGLIWGYEITNYGKKQRAQMWFDAFFKDDKIYSLKITFGSNQLYKNYIFELVKLKVKKVEEKILKDEIKSFYMNNKYYYILSTNSGNKNQLPFSLEVQENSN